MFSGAKYIYILFVYLFWHFTTNHHSPLFLLKETEAFAPNTLKNVCFDTNKIFITSSQISHREKPSFMNYT